MSSWSVKDAKNDFSKLIKAANDEPQIITSHGQKVAVVYKYGDQPKNISFPKRNLAKYLKESKKLFEDAGVEGNIKIHEDS